jgi:hypothetical protein
MTQVWMSGRRLVAAALMASAAITPAWAAAPSASLTIRSPTKTAVMTAEEIAQLPSITVTVSFGTEHGKAGGVFEGPLLWLVLAKAGAVDPKKPRQQVTDTAVVTGADGYVAALALGELGPDFENKTVILAERMDGKPLGPDHLRLVVPGDRKGGRNVRDVRTIDVTTAR